jgi:subtilisin family serine protease
MKKQRLGAGVFVGIALVGAVFVTVFFENKYTPHGPDGKPPVTQPPGAAYQRESRDFGGVIFANDDDRDSPFPWQTEAENVTQQRTRFSQVPVRKGLKQENFITINNKTYPLRTYQPLSMPNDPLANQWWVTSSRLDSAWDMAQGGYQTTLAIIDTGFALAHEDLDGRWHENAQETGATSSEGSSRLNCTDRGMALDYSCNLVDDDVDGIVDNESGAAPYENASQLNCTDRGVTLTKNCNRIDDDGNGYIDDVRGWDVINQDNSVQTGELSPAGESTSHGTMVAGVAAATGNNAKGVAGVNWQTKILPIQALDDDGYGNTRTVGESIHYAIDQGADVINISLGAEHQDDYVREAIELATAAGITVVAAAGNDGCDCVTYPAKYPEVVAVGSLDQNGALAGFSSWGAAIDIIAPGTNFTLPSWSNAVPTARYTSGAAGTSFSSPLVAGTAALLKSHQPSAQPLHLIAALHETTNRSGLVFSGPHSTRYGFGKVDARAVRERMTTPRHVAQAYVFSPVNAGNYFTGKSFEFASPYSMRDCEGWAPSLPLYELKSSTKSFYSMSEAEVRYAAQAGFTATNFAYVCLSQPHDTTDALRMINIFREFRNISPKN